jgi:hypothetical protein
VRAIAKRIAATGRERSALQNRVAAADTLEEDAPDALDEDARLNGDAVKDADRPADDGDDESDEPR